MPAFTFEKISPPVRRSPRPSSAGEPRSGLIRILARTIGRVLPPGIVPLKGVTARREHKLPQ